MKRPALALTAAMVAAGCAGTPVAPSAARHGVTATFEIDKKTSSLYQRGVLYVTPTRNLQITVDAPDLATPFTTTKTLDSLDDGVSLTVDGVPEGTLRVVTLQWTDDAGKPLDGVFYRAQGTLDEHHQHLLFNNQSTAEGSVLLACLKKHHDAAAILKSEDITNWMYGVLTTAHVADSRFLDVDAIADAIVGMSTKNMPTPKPEWGLAPGYVSVSFSDIQADLRLQAAVSDPTSGAGVTGTGETLVLGPIPARPSPYKLGVQVLATGTELIGADLAMTPVDVTVTAGKTVTAGPVSFAKSTAGTAMPERAGRGAALTISGGSEDQLWIVGGLKRPDGAFNGLTWPAPTPVASYNPITDPYVAQTPTETVGAAGTAYRYVDSTHAWDKPLALPTDTFPLYGMAAAGVGSKIYCFGGYVNQLRSNYTAIINTGGSPSLQANPFAMAQADGDADTRLVNATAGAIGTTIYIAGGTAHTDTSDGSNDAVAAPTTLNQTLVFDTTTNTFQSPTDPPRHIYQDMAGAVAGGKFYLFGGSYMTPGAGGAVLTPSAAVQVFDPASGWSQVAAMPTARYGAATAVGADGKLWVIGGETLRGAPSRAVEVFDPAANRWTRRAPLRTPRSYAAAFVAKRGGSPKVVVAGGVEGYSPQGLPMPVDKALVEELTP